MSKFLHAYPKQKGKRREKQCHVGDSINPSLRFVTKIIPKKVGANSSSKAMSNDLMKGDDLEKSDDLK